jgi:hypothetical protein
MPGVDECPHAWYRIYPSAEQHAKMHVVMTPQLLKCSEPIGESDLATCTDWMWGRWFGREGLRWQDQVYKRCARGVW